MKKIIIIALMSIISINVFGQDSFIKEHSELVGEWAAEYYKKHPEEAEQKIEMLTKMNMSRTGYYPDSLVIGKLILYKSYSSLYIRPGGCEYYAYLPIYNQKDIKYLENNGFKRELKKQLTKMSFNITDFEIGMSLFVCIESELIKDKLGKSVNEPKSIDGVRVCVMSTDLEDDYKAYEARRKQLKEESGISMKDYYDEITDSLDDKEENMRKTWLATRRARRK